MKAALAPARKVKKRVVSKVQGYESSMTSSLDSGSSLSDQEEDKKTHGLRL